MLWRDAALKAIRSLPWYAAFGLSLAVLLQLIGYLVGGGSFNLRTYWGFVALFLVLWLIRQFFRFWATVFRSHSTAVREYRQN